MLVLMTRASRMAWLGVTIGFLGALAGIGVPFLRNRPPPPREALIPSIAVKSSYLILATDSAAANYRKAIDTAKALHPDAAFGTFSPADLARARKTLLEDPPRYVLVFIEPEELDVNFAWEWLALTTSLNDDPFVDVRTGFITGATPDDAAAFMARIAAARGELKLPGAFADNFGPNLQAAKGEFQTSPGNFMIPIMEKRFAISTISHGIEGFTDQRLGSMKDAGLIHFGGHGYPDRIDQGMRAAQAGRLELSPCVVFNGACYTGVTGRWFEQFTPDGKVAEKKVAVADSLCLNLLRNQAVAYFAALHPDHGVPVYQEMEFLAYTGASLGDVIKHTHDGVILAAGGKLPRFERLTDKMPAPQWTPADVMLKGTASRILFGDPSMIITPAFADPPFKVSQKADGDGLVVTATLANPSLKSTYADTYYSDLSKVSNLFNDRALIAVDLPRGWDGVSSVQVTAVRAGDRTLRHRLVGHGVEILEGSRRLIVQVDIESNAYMQSAFRAAGATVELNVKR